MRMKRFSFLRKNVLTLKRMQPTVSKVRFFVYMFLAETPRKRLDFSVGVYRSMLYGLHFWQILPFPSAHFIEFFFNSKNVHPICFCACFKYPDLQNVPPSVVRIPASYERGNPTVEGSLASKSTHRP